MSINIYIEKGREKKKEKKKERFLKGRNLGTLRTGEGRVVGVLFLMMLVFLLFLFVFC